MVDEKKTKVKKGTLAVQVGLNDQDLRKFVIPISYLSHPSFKGLLDKAYELYGYHSAGPLRLPCSVEDFLQLRWSVEREGASSRHIHHQIHHSLSLI